jgi:hypothetical protein
MSSHDQQRLDHAKELIMSSYDLTSGKCKNMHRAVEKLKHALSIQRDVLGKHHNDGGWTCHWIGSAYEKLGEPCQAIKYFFEARRTFFKNRHGNVKAIAQRIRCVLNVRMGFSPEYMEHHIMTLKRANTHEFTADQLKASGKEEAAKKEYRTALPKQRPEQSMVCSS